MNKLARLASEGRLSNTQQAEMEAYLYLGRLMSILHSKARMSLRGGEARTRRKAS